MAKYGIRFRSPNNPPPFSSSKMPCCTLSALLNHHFCESPYGVTPGHLVKRSDYERIKEETMKSNQVRHTIKNVNYETISRLGALHSDWTGQIMNAGQVYISDVVAR